MPVPVTLGRGEEDIVLHCPLHSPQYHYQYVSSAKISVPGSGHAH